MVFGTDLYGGVNQVGETSIKTKFFHIGTIPIIPLGSYYFVEGSEEESSNLNLLVYQSNSSSFSSIEYDGVNAKSVIIGYIRYISGIIGVIGVFLLIASIFTDGGILRETTFFINISLSLFLILFYLTYIWGGNKNIEDIVIRQFSEEYFGIGFNPDNIKKDMAQTVIDTTQNILIENNIDNNDVLKNIDRYDNSVIGLVLIKLKSEVRVNNEDLKSENIDKCLGKLI